MHISLRQKELLTGSIVMILCFGSLLGAETALRLQQLLAFGGGTNVETSAKFFVDEQTGLRLPVPGSDHGRMSFNALGFRSPDIVVPKPKDTVRIAYLGSSTTLDPFVSGLEATWAHQVTQEVQRAWPQVSVDYVNASTPGIGTESMLAYFEYFVRNAEPDLVIVSTSDQSSDMDRIAIEQGIHDGVHYRPSWLAAQSVLWSKIEKNAVIIQRQRAAFASEGKLQFEAQDFAPAFEDRLNDLITAIQDSGALPVLLSRETRLRADQSRQQKVAAANTFLFTMPYMSISGLLEAQDVYNNVIRTVAQSRDIPYVNWAGIVPADEEHFADSQHFLNPGSKLMAQFVARAIVEKVKVYNLENTTTLSSPAPSNTKLKD